MEVGLEEMGLAVAEAKGGSEERVTDFEEVGLAAVGLAVGLGETGAEVA